MALPARSGCAALPAPALQRGRASVSGFVLLPCDVQCLRPDSASAAAPRAARPQVAEPDALLSSAAEAPHRNAHGLDHSLVYCIALRSGSSLGACNL
eukprot:6210667-Pleurochrysis_carterae.AAC.3